MMSGKPISFGQLGPPVPAQSQVPGAGNDGNASFLSEAARRRLVTEYIEQFRAWPDEGDARALAGARQCRILGQETVAGMNRIDAFFLGEGDDALDVKISLHRAFAGADQVSFIGLETVQGETVLLRVDGYRAQVEFVGGAKDADGDFAAIERLEVFSFRGPTRRLKKKHIRVCRLSGNSSHRGHRLSLHYHRRQAVTFFAFPLRVIAWRLPLAGTNRIGYSKCDSPVTLSFFRSR